jgi:VWFA-related protein
MRVPVPWCVTLLWVLASVPHVRAVPATAQAPPQQQQAGLPARQAAGPADSDNAPLRVDAVVTDRQGRPILSLRPSDFELIENGSPRPLVAVELRTTARAASAAAPVADESDETRAASQPGTRVFAFLLDEYHITPGESAERARGAVARFINEQMQPQDLAVVMKPLDAVSGLRLTRNRAILHAALAGFSGRKGDLTPRPGFEEDYIGRAPAAVAAARSQIVTAALNELTMRLGDVRADRGVIVLVSEGFPQTLAPARGTRVLDLQGVVRASSRFNLSIYTFNPGTLPAAPAAGTTREPASATLESLAAQTGGRAVLHGPDLAAGFARMSDDLAAYYALTYRPAHIDGRFHAIEVRAKGRNVAVRTRPGYWAPLGGEWRSLLGARTMPPLSTRAPRRSALVNTWIGIASDPSGHTRMVITWEPGATVPTPAHVVVVQARTTAGAELFTGDVAPVHAASGGSPDSARFEVPPGRVELDLSIRDVQGKVLDTEIRDFDVPDLRSQKRGPMLLYPALVRTRTLREFHTAIANPDAAPSSARVFARGDRLVIRVPAYDSSGVPVQVSAKVLNEWGHPMRDIEAADEAGGTAQFALPLYWLVPGQYLIEVAGANANGTVRERVAFRVRG